jgi:hypothetical protein
MKISKYMQLSQADRQKHIDLNKPCFQPYKRWNTGRKYAAPELLDLLSVDTFSFSGENIHIAHSCCNDSHSVMPCINPYHLYLATPSENYMDVDKTKRVKRSYAGGKANWEATKHNHNFHKTRSCQYCNKTFNVRGIWRHENSCRRKHEQQ